MSYEAVLVQLEPGSQDGQPEVPTKFGQLGPIAVSLIPKSGMLIRQSSAGSSINTPTNPITVSSTSSAPPVISTSSTNSAPRFQLYAVPVPTLPFSQGTNGAVQNGGSLRPAPTKLVFKGTDQAPKNLIKVGELPATIARNVIQCSTGTYTLKNSQIPVGTINSQMLITNPVNGKPPSAMPIKQQLRYTGRASWAGTNGTFDLSTTPDSGIQSVPGTPNAEVLSPPNTELFSSFSEDICEEHESFDDMPLLLPANQEDNLLTLLSDSLPQPGSARNVDDSVESGVHGSECEQPTGPSHSINISPNMDPSEIAEIIAQCMDPEKVKTLTNLMRKKAKQATKETNPMVETEDWLKKDGKLGKKRSRPTSGGSEETRRSEEEGIVKLDIKTEPQSDPPSNKIPKVEINTKKTQKSAKNQEIESKKSEIRNEDIPSTSKTNDDPFCIPASTSTTSMIPESIKEYRRAARERLNQRVEELWLKIGEDFINMRINDKKKDNSSKTPKFPIRIKWTEIERRIRENSKIQQNNQRIASKKVPKVRIEEMKKEELMPITKKPGRPPKDIKNKKLRVQIQRLEKSGSEAAMSPKRNQEYIPINTSIAMEGGRVSGWSHPPPNSPCGCKRDCSDSCLYRLIRIQCTSTCQAENCQNKPFLSPCEDLYVDEKTKGKENRSRTGLYSRKKISPGQFVCEFAGEVVNQKEMDRRIKEDYIDKQIRALALCSRIFVDSTTKGNIGRFVNHSCKSNAQFQVWLVNGRLKAGIFAKQEIEKATEITVSFSRQSPIEFQCSCRRCLSQKSPIINKAARNPYLAMADDISIKEEKIVRKEHIFLERNRSLIIHRAVWNGAPIRLMAVDRVGKGSRMAMRHVLQLMTRRVRYADGSMPYRFLSFYSQCIQSLRSPIYPKNKKIFFKSLEEFAKEANCYKLFKKLVDRYLSKNFGEEIKIESKMEKEEKNELNRMEEKTKKRLSGVNLDYLHSEIKIGGYDPDEAWPEGKANECDEAVRCVCGSLEEDGEMLQCDECHYWLHNDCIGMTSDQPVDEYKCNFCNGKIITGRPSMDVILKNQPEVSFPGCTYFKALVNDFGIQVRLNETVYVEKLSGDEHKKALKKSLEQSEAQENEKKSQKKALKTRKSSTKLEKREFSRQNVGIMRVERLILTSDGKRWVFGFYYARPHETFKDPTRKFHPNEVLSTQMYDTLPLSSVVGRCAVLPSSIWTKGYPQVPKYQEKDILFCEFEMHSKTRVIKKLPDNQHYFVNQQPYSFKKLETTRRIQRTFQPFATPSPAKVISEKKIKQEVDEPAKEITRLDRIIDRLRLSTSKTPS